MPTASEPAIQYVIIIVQENRSTDNLFHGLPGADTASRGVDSHGNVIPLHPIALTERYDLSHLHDDFVAEYDGGKMDGADLVHVNCEGRPCPTNGQFAYVDPADVAPYFQMAERYVFADRMFQSNQGPSYPAHQYLISGTAEPAVGSQLLAVGNPYAPGGGGAVAGCDAPAGTKVAMISPDGRQNMQLPPCFEHPTLTDLLDASGISWNYFASAPSSIWTGPNSIQHIRFGPDWPKVITPETKVLTTIAQGQLAHVTWVMPTIQISDHPGANDGSGPSWVTSIVNAIGGSRYWPHAAIFITWDDWGGWYDHVAPSIFNAGELGLRVPLIVVSPYARAGYVSHVPHEFGSILHFTETQFGLGSLGFTDARADDLSDCFDFARPPRPFVPLNAPIHAAHFGPGLLQTNPDND